MSLAMPLRVIYFGTPQFAVPTLKRLLADPAFEVAGVVTQPDKRRGRGRGVMPSPVKQVAQKAELPIWQPQRIKADEPTLAQLETVRADAFVVVAYGQLLSAQILAMPRLGCINGHGSLLPAYRGAAPIQWCLVQGETTTGMTAMQMDIGMDTGPMLQTTTLPIGLLDHSLDLAAALAQQCADLLPRTLLALDQGTITPIPQDEAQATYAPLIQKADYTLDWQQSALDIHNRVRGFYPNAVTAYRNQPLKVLATAPLVAHCWPHLPADLVALRPGVEALSSAEPPGTVLALLKGQGPVIATGAGPILLRQVKPSGKQAQSGWDFANGSRLQVGETLG